METQVKARQRFCPGWGRFVCGNSAFSQQISTFYGPSVQTMETRLGHGSDGGPRRFTAVVPTPHDYSGQWPVKTKRARARNCASVVTRKRPSLNRAQNEPIYERPVVKRGGADFVSQGSRTSPSPSASVDLAHLRPVRGRFSVHPATHPLSPRPRESFLPQCRQALGRRAVSSHGISRTGLRAGIELHQPMRRPPADEIGYSHASGHRHLDRSPLNR